MNKYVATVRVGGSSVKTVVFAENTLHARLLLQYQFGMDSVLISPSQTTEDTSDIALLDELIAPIKPLSPQQAKLTTLKKQKELANNALKAERDRQKISKAQQQIRSVVQRKS